MRHNGKPRPMLSPPRAVQWLRFKASKFSLLLKYLWMPLTIEVALERTLLDSVKTFTYYCLNLSTGVGWPQPVDAPLTDAVCHGGILFPKLP